MEKRKKALEKAKGGKKSSFEKHNPGATRYEGAHDFFKKKMK